jgi:hypothetical protein
VIARFGLQPTHQRKEAQAFGGWGQGEKDKEVWGVMKRFIGCLRYIIGH